MDRRNFLQTVSSLGLATAFPISAGAIASSRGTEFPLTSSKTTSTIIGTAVIEPSEGFQRISIVAIGGAARSVVSEAMDKLPGNPKVVAINTDPISLCTTPAHTRILIGEAGRKPISPNSARSLAAAQAEDISLALADSDMALIVAGMGGSTGTGVAPVIAEIARANGAMTAAMAILPFDWEGRRRSQIAAAGLHTLERRTDLTLPISNATLQAGSNQDTLLAGLLSEGSHALENLYWSVSGCVRQSGLVNEDLEDIRLLVASRKAAIGWGGACGDGRATRAVTAALNHPLLGRDRLASALGVHVSIRSTRESLKMREVNETLSTVRNAIPVEAQVLFSANYPRVSSETLEIGILATYA